uniref:Phenazine biosynthesis-like domain-containing protein n=1 Tax=Strigamia maritima TaxID=126957 RepID=T1IWX5_STRMM
MATSVPIYTVDAFTSNLFSGNPAAVCLLDEDLCDEIKQKIATELNLSETCFLTKINDQDSFFNLRWFTPTNEVPLCGHGTLSTAAVLFYICKNQGTRLEFQTKSGLLAAQKQGEFISLDMPLNPPQKLDQQQQHEMKAIISAAVGNLPYDDVQYNSRTKKLLICLSDTLSRSHFENIKLTNESLLNAHNTGQVGGLILTLGGPNAKPYDFLSRYFSPWNGVNEDPVCGSAHSVLTPFWAKILNKKELTARQCSRRGGELWITLRDDGRVDIKGNAKIVIQGTLNL